MPTHSRRRRPRSLVVPGAANIKESLVAFFEEYGEQRIPHEVTWSWSCRRFQPRCSCPPFCGLTSIPSRNRSFVECRQRATAQIPRRLSARQGRATRERIRKRTLWGQACIRDGQCRGAGGQRRGAVNTTLVLVVDPPPPGSPSERTLSIRGVLGVVPVDDEARSRARRVEGVSRSVVDRRARSRVSGARGPGTRSPTFETWDRIYTLYGWPQTFIGNGSSR